MKIFNVILIFSGIVSYTYTMEQQPIALDIQQQIAQNFVAKYNSDIVRFKKNFVQKLGETFDAACRAEQRGEEVCKLFVNTLNAGQKPYSSEPDPMLLDIAFVRLWSRFSCSVPGPRAITYVFYSRGGGPFRCDDRIFAPQLPVKPLLENAKNFITAVLSEIEKS